MNSQKCFDDLGRTGACHAAFRSDPEFLHEVVGNANALPRAFDTVGTMYKPEKQFSPTLEL
jgi:hypothetical protein